MVIYFKSKKLQKICNINKEAIKSLGTEYARKLQQRLMELRAAGSLADIPHTPPQRRHQYINDPEGRISVDLKDQYRIIFVVVNDPIPLRIDGGLDLEAVTEIEIIDIKYDPH